ncbi:hypothetical protein [Brucella neotomae]|uniref:Glyceraldehyde-3-phosphate dehydrogenase n=1 Tax=Brucella neotomae 5K33 TaxID=520456 RepID=A0A7U8PWL7_BRUNE|nr:hypothetical protein [Brucella neotomae]EEY03429.1 conserved hypothetical protein [Brucella neotomae 5K33]KEX98679.1 glyceraldehyde-3-phosphate dehydrogenase [Brucella neotomae 5K33]KFJ56604.1 hypothetical protein DK64_1593 [Brucella neotomae 5K33]SPU66990.1 glyceraldehyde 3-phosphate dehydrogenase [Brucella neotomae]SPU70512.1 glyceraldehyde 3-phosphate dehydrogenase [Brucella neotomae]
MDNIFAALGDITPTIDKLDTTQSPPVLYLNIVNGSVVATCAPWDSIRTDQTAFLLLNDVVIDSQPIEAQDPTGPTPRLGKPPQFTIPVANNFSAGNEYNIQIKVTDTVQNIGISQKLTFDVREDSLEKDLKIDITEGAAGYTDDYPYLMPANIAVIQGPPNMQLTARGRGKVRFQDVGGADICNFYFDENGVAPLVLIRIDKLHVDAVAASIQDQIYITRRGQTDEIFSRPVSFDDYVPVTDPNLSSAIDSVSCNTVGIADGNTICIINIVFNKSYIDTSSDDTIFIVIPDGLSLSKNLFNKNFPIRMAGPNLPTVKIVDYTAEFGVSAEKPGTYKVSFFPSKSALAYFSKDILFKELS